MLLILVACVRSKAEEIDFEAIPCVSEVFCWEVANEFNISEALLISVCWQESKFNKEVVGGNVSQITNLKWFSEGITYTDAKDPKGNQFENIRILGYYLHKWAVEYPEEPYLWVDMWNKGYEKALVTYNPNNPSRYARTVVNRIPQIEEYIYRTERKNKP